MVRDFSTPRNQNGPEKVRIRVIRPKNGPDRDGNPRFPPTCRAIGVELFISKCATFHLI